MSTSNCKEKEGSDLNELESAEQGKFQSFIVFLQAILHCMFDNIILLLSACLDYKQIDKQLDQIDAVLSNLENKRDNLHEEAIKLLHEAKEIRSINKAEQQQYTPEQ